MSPLQYTGQYPVASADLGPAARPFDPLDLLAPYGPVLWHDDRGFVYSDDAGATIQSADAVAIGSIQNQAPGGALLTQAGATERATLQLAEINGRNSIQFDGGDYYDAAISAAVLPCVMFHVIKVTDFSAARTLQQSNTANQGVRSSTVITTGTIRVTVDAALSSVSTTALVAGALTVTASKILADGTYSFFFNGVKDATTGTMADTSPAAANVRLGANATPSTFFLGQQPAFGRCHGAVPDDVIVAVSRGLMRWYGIA